MQMNSIVKGVSQMAARVLGSALMSTLFSFWLWYPGILVSPSAHSSPVCLPDNNMKECTMTKVGSIMRF